MILERINSFNSRKVPCAYVITKDENGFAVRTMTSQNTSVNSKNENFQMS